MNEYTRNLNPKEIEKNLLFNQELEERGLCLAVTRKWGNRTLSTSSAEWKKLRKSTLKNADFTCRFCGIRSEKWMVCDHIDGDASNNSPDNLGINCPICDLLRHCGRAGIYGQLSVWTSDLSQVEIVTLTQQYWIEHGRIPKPNEIDSKAIRWSRSSVKFANILLTSNYSELGALELQCRGFFEEEAASAFNKVLPTKN